MTIPTPLHVLVIDDEKNIRVTLVTCLESIACRVTAVASSEAARTALARQHFDLAFLDLRLGQESGLDLIPTLLADTPTLAIVVITAYATVETAVEAIKRGATDYLPKPFTPVQVRHLVERFAERRQLTMRIRDLEARVRETVPEADIETASPKMRAVLEILTRVAPTDAPVLLRGESGTGKSVAARLLHTHSARADKPWVTVNCPTLSEELLASELFGHIRGAFTGAMRDQPGRVEMAAGGTLFLDEIGELTPELQAKLLRFLQDKQFERLGENKTRHADVRVIAATNRDLDSDVKTGRFREDLLYRLNVIEVTLPPLRERPEDIVPLARGFLAFFARGTRRSSLEFSPAAEQTLLTYAWPGNVRELRNAIERAAILWPAPLIDPAAFPERIAAHAARGPRLGGDDTLEAIEREHVLRVLARTSTVEEAARILGIDASTLWRKRKKYEEATPTT
jgi:two-component system, NtrC family, response regulator AlgB